MSASADRLADSRFLSDENSSPSLSPSKIASRIASPALCHAREIESKRSKPRGHGEGIVRNEIGENPIATPRQKLGDEQINATGTRGPDDAVRVIRCFCLARDMRPFEVDCSTMALAILARFLTRLPVCARNDVCTQINTSNDRRMRRLGMPASLTVLGT